MELFKKKIFVFEFLTLGRAHGREYDGNVRGRMEERQEIRIRNRREDGRAKVRG